MDNYAFNPWSQALDRQEANEAIAERIERMQKDYTEILLLADTFDIRVNFELELPDEVKCAGRHGHNQNAWVHWSASAAEC